MYLSKEISLDYDKDFVGGGLNDQVRVGLRELGMEVVSLTGTGMLPGGSVAHTQPRAVQREKDNL